MREIIDGLFADSEHHELYIGVIETTEGLVHDFPQDAWKRKMVGDAKFEQEILLNKRYF